MNDTEICGARHPIDRSLCTVTTDHNYHVNVRGLAWRSIQRPPKFDNRERVKGRHRRDARSWAWTESQR